MSSKKYKIIITLSVLLLFPTGLGLVPWYFYNRWQRQPDEKNTRRLETMLQYSLILLFMQLCAISLLFYNYGRYLIHVMGTFY